MTAPLLQVDGLVKRFGGLAATDGASLAVHEGEVLALIGPNGAGKTTLVHQLAGGLRPDAGRIRFAGDDITALPMPRRVHLGLARSYQITNVFAALPVLDNLALAVQARTGGSLRFWRPARAERARYDEAAAFAARVGLGDRLAVRAGDLSHGEQRALEVGLALATRPRLLLLDEPMAGMGPDETARLLELLQSLRQEVTLLLVEHDMDVVFRLADRIATLVSGRVIACDRPEAIRANADVRRAYLGEETP